MPPIRHHLPTLSREHSTCATTEKCWCSKCLGPQNVALDLLAFICAYRENYRLSRLTVELWAMRAQYVYFSAVATIVSKDLTLFADDTSIFIWRKDLNELMANAKLCLERFNEWLIENRLSPSIEKSNYVIYHSPSNRIGNAFINISIKNLLLKE